MKMKDFFSFIDKSFSITYQVGSTSLDLEDKPEDKSDHDDLILGNHENITFPVIFVHEYGRKLRDMIGTGWPGLYLITDHFREILRESHISGWKTFPIKIYDKRKNEINGYNGFSVTGRSGEINYSHCQAFKKRYVPEGPICTYYKGRRLDLEEWDGSDFFVPEERTGILVTKRVVSVVKKHKITNIEFNRFIESEIDDDSFACIMKRQKNRRL